MKKITFISLLIIEYLLAIGQKQALDFRAIDGWPHIKNEKISDNGKYVLYDISSKIDGDMLIVQSTEAQLKVRIKNASRGVFTHDSRYIIFKTFSDSLGIMELETGITHLVGKIRSFGLPSYDNNQWVAYQLQDTVGDLVLLNLTDGTKLIYPRTNIFTISDNGKYLLLHHIVLHNDVKHDSVTRVDLNSRIEHFIWQGTGAFNWAMDKSGSQIAFIQKRKLENKNDIVLWYYKDGMDSARLLVNDSTRGMLGSAIGARDVFFSADGNNLFFYTHVVAMEQEDESKSQAQCITWSYQDKTLEILPRIRNEERQTVVNLRSPLAMAVLIEVKEGDNSYARSIGGYSNNKIVLIGNLVGRDWEYNWRPSAIRDLYLVSTVDGTRTLLKRSFFGEWGTYVFSPDGHYLFWFDLAKGHWFSHNLRTGCTINLTASIPVSLSNTSSEAPGYSPSFGMAGWMENDSALLIYDKYDIWKVDPDGAVPPRNITFGYGRSHHEILRVLNINGDQYTSFSRKDTLPLYTFSPVSKLNGFAQLVLNDHDKPVLFPQVPLKFYGVSSGELTSDPSTDDFGLKATHAKAYIFRPTRDTMYPNLIFTKDLIHFRQLTELEPQKQFNWYTTELIHWKQSNGLASEGILFKPEDFDSKKKYPLIVFVYQTFSDALNVFLKPALCRGDIEILWYISHDYLILVPDIHYKIGRPAESAYQSVISAINCLSRKPWVDMKRLGLQGHSFGGYEVNYILTKTNLFAAACSANAVVDVISMSGQLLDNSGYQGFFELGQGRMGATLWQRPGLYIKESPIFGADKVSTPLLVLHNSLDNAVYFSQAAEWFTALRRLGKKAWMLQYTNERHNLEKEENQLDYSIRLSQFFDHFLKDAPTPTWMRGE